MVKMFRLNNGQETDDPRALGHISRAATRRARFRRKGRGNDSGGPARGSHFFEWTHKRSDGEEFPATVLMTRMEQAGTVVIQATVRDVTEQKRAEEVLRKHATDVQREYDNLQAVFDAAQIGFVLVDQREEVVRVTICSPRSSARTRPSCSAAGRATACVV